MRYHHFIKYLNLKKPIKVEISSRPRKKVCAKYWALYDDNGNLHSHLIRVYGFDHEEERGNIEVTIAHELIHAWQEENGYKDIHGQSFQFMATLMEKDFKLTCLYLSKVDI